MAQIKGHGPQNLFGEEYPIPQETQDIVEEVLRDVPASRDNDMLLYAEVWKRQGFVIHDRFVEGAVKAETIGRHRRFLQSKGQYLGTRQKQRSIAERTYKKAFDHSQDHDNCPSCEYEI